MSLFLPPAVRATDANNDALPGAKWYFYATGGTTPQPVFTTSALNVAHTNPVVADSAGLFAPIYLDTSLSYRAVLKTSSGMVIQDTDPYNFATIIIGSAANFVSSPTSTLFVRPSSNIADGTLFYSSTPDFITPKPLEIRASEVLIEPSEKIQINPTPLSYALGFDIVQSTPTSGSQAGPFFANTIDFTARSTLTGTGLPGGATSATFGGFRVSVDPGGANFGCVSVMGASVSVTHTVADTSTGDKNGLSSGVSSTASSPGKLYGGSSAWSVLSGGSTPAAVGYETDVTISGTGAVDHAIGFNAWKGGTGSGAINDAAYAIGISGAGGAAKWKVGHLLYTQGGITASPVDSTTSLFKSDHTTTLSSIFDYDNVTIANYIFTNANVKLTGAGALGLNTSLSSIGIGSTAPTDVWLKIAASTTTKPHLRLVAGVAPTSPTVGDFWSDGTNLKWVNGAGVTKTVTVT